MYCGRDQKQTGIKAGGSGKGKLVFDPEAGEKSVPGCQERVVAVYSRHEKRGPHFPGCRWRGAGELSGICLEWSDGGRNAGDFLVYGG